MSMEKHAAIGHNVWEITICTTQDMWEDLEVAMISYRSSGFFSHWSCVVDRDSVSWLSVPAHYLDFTWRGWESALEQLLVLGL